MGRGVICGLVSAAALMATTLTLHAQTGQEATRLLRDPDLHGNQLAFVYAGDIWVANADGSDPRRLTSDPASEHNPLFSPDGSMIAFSADYDGNDDVYVISTAGGQPKRLTWHSDTDTAIDWTPDGSQIAFVSSREREHGRSAQLFHVDLDGGLPEKRMEARIVRGDYNADGSKLAYISFGPAYNGLYANGSAGWRGYRGGTNPDVMIMDLGAAEVTQVPSNGTNDLDPKWMDGKVYFISDRDDKVFNLFVFDPASGEVDQLTDEDTWDIRHANADGGRLVYEVGGQLKIFDVASGKSTTLSISINPDLPQLRPAWKNVAGNITNGAISPNGKRAIVTARGDIFTVPTDAGSVRNISRSSGVHDYTGIWSPKGDKVAYINAAEENQVLVIEDQTGLEEARRIDLGEKFHSLLTWSPDASRIAYTNHELQLLVVNLDSGDITTISTGARRDQIEAAFSPDSQWLAYTEEQPNFNRALMLYNFASGERAPVADAMADTASPAFSKDGKYLYFAASTNSGPAQVGLDMSSQERPYRAGLYVAVLAADGDSPLKPESGDEEATDEAADRDDKGDEASEEDTATRIDTNGLSDRLIALQVPEANYGNLATGKDGALYYVRFIQPGTAVNPPGDSRQTDNELVRYDFDKHEASTVMNGVNGFDMSATGEHMLIAKPGGQWVTGKAGEKIDAKPLNTGDLRMMIDPREEWAAIFDEAWLMEKHYFYDPGMHGLDWDAIYDRYRPLVAHVGRREDLTELIVEMIAEMQVGHNNSGGGDVYRGSGPGVGQLGINLAPDNGAHRITKIYSGERWNPFIKGPMAQPGMDVSAGDYILAVNGVALGENDNIHEHLQGTVDKQVTLRIADSADGDNARDVVVEPIGSDNALRLWDWVESNRQRVAEATDGRVGYVYLPNTAGAGFTFFNRMFFAQVDKDAMIIDERANGGGQAANYITDVLSRTYLSGWKDRSGMVFNTPGGAMYGPKVMLIDQDAGSGGDFLPYSFREMGIGPLIGKRTWGGLIGIFANPRLIDGGVLTVPFFRFFDADYEWTVENEGVAPDIDVALDPIATNKGRDTQLERAIREIETLLKTAPSEVPTQAPPYPEELGQ